MLTHILAPPLAAAVLLAGGAAAGSGPTLRLVASRDPGALDPALAFFESSGSMLNASCTPLMRATAGRRGRTVKPGGAAGFPKVSADGRTYTFTIRSDLRFSDGSPVRAANYARGLGRVLDPAMRSPLAPFLSDVVAARGRGRTLRIRLKQPAGDFLSRATQTYFCPVPLGYPVDPAGVTLTVGSGPYRIAAYTPGQGATLRPNPFWRGSRPRFSTIVLTVTGTPESTVRDTEAGKYDYSYDNVPNTLVPELVARHGIGRGQLLYKRQAITEYLAMNLHSPLFRGNLALRRAVNVAIDRPELVRANPFSANRTDQILPPVVPGFRNANLYPLKGANVRLAARLARGNLRGGRAVLYSRANPVAIRQARTIAYNLAQIGLDIEIKSFATSVLLQRLRNPSEQWDLAGTLFWFADVPDPYNFVGEFFGEPWRSPSSANLTRFQEPRIFARIRRADRLTGAARYEALGELEIEVLRDHAPVAAIAHLTGLTIVSSRVGCARFNPLGGIDLTSFCLRPTFS